MSDWQKGDLALCVKDAPGSQIPRAGEILTVSYARPAREGFPDAGRMLLFFPGRRSAGASGGFYTERFRKVTPDKADEWDRETIALMNGKPARVCADMLSGVRS